MNRTVSLRQPHTELLEPIYLDHHATTPVDQRVIQVVTDSMNATYGNANGVENVYGEAAARVLAGSAQVVADLEGAQAEEVRRW